MDVDEPRRSFVPQVITAVVFTAIATGIVVAARMAAEAPVEADVAAGEAGAADVPTGPAPNPLTPATARSPRELNAALLKHFGTNRRGMSFVTVVDYDAHADRLHISFALDEATIAAPSARAGGLRKAAEVLAALRGNSMKWTWALLTATAPAPDESGEPGETTVLRVLVARDRLRSIDWDQSGADKVQSAAEQFWLHPDLGK